MADERLADGTRIAQLIASEVTGHESSLADLSVVDADTDAEPSADGTLAYRVARGREAFAEVYVRPESAGVQFLAESNAAAAAADAEGLRARTEAAGAPPTIVDVEDGGDAKRAAAVFEAAARATDETARGATHADESEDGE